MKEIITSAHAPAPIGPYSQAVKCGNMLFVSGAIAVNPQTGNYEPLNIEEETHQVMRNLKAILLEANAGFENVVKTTIFLKNMDDFAKVNAVYGTYFKSAYPARETVQVSRLPKDVSVEISVTAMF